MHANWTRRQLLAAGAMGLVSVLGAGCGGGGSENSSRARLLYASREMDRTGLYTINSDGSEKKRLTNPGEGAPNSTQVYDTRAKPLTDGSGRIIFLRARVAGDQITYYSFRCDLYVIDRDGQNLRRVVEDVSIGSTYDISPDGSTILYVPRAEAWTGVPQKVFIYTASATGGGGRIFAEGDNPAYSPDGSTVLFERSFYTSESAEETVARSNLFLVNADGSNERALTTGLDYHTDPRWAPDGSRIVFHFAAGGLLITSSPNYQWFGINLDGTGKGPTDLLRPEFPQRLSPPANSGENYHLQIGKYDNIYRINADGSERKITNEGSVREACWLP